MTTENSRFTQLRIAAQAASRLGIFDRAQRRELVIDAQSAVGKGLFTAKAQGTEKDILTVEDVVSFPSIALADLDTESEDVKRVAINKYVDVEWCNPDKPILIDAIHHKEPTVGELKDVISTSASTAEIQERIQLLKDGVTEGDDLFQEVKKIREGFFENSTHKIAARVAELTDTTLVSAKKSRLTSDLNRSWWIREERSNTNAREYSRSARAGYYWAVKSILDQSQLLDSEGKLKHNFLRVSIHGMKDRDYDVAIAGSKNPADERVITWFQTELQKELDKIEGFGKVVIAKSDDPQTWDYSGVASTSHYRKEPQKEYAKQHPAFGESFHSIQVEIARRIRTNPETREKFCQAMANVINNAPEFLNNLENE